MHVWAAEITCAHKERSASTMTVRYRLNPGGVAEDHAFAIRAIQKRYVAPRQQQAA
jgi:hypothetical protein